jgi:hypothetical protein
MESNILSAGGYMKNIIQDLKVKNYEFTALVESLALTDKENAYLGVTEPELLTVSGSFNIEWDGSSPLVQIDVCYVENGKKEIQASDDLLSILEAKIENSGYELQWLADRIADAEDYYLDNE